MADSCGQQKRPEIQDNLSATTCPVSPQYGIHPSRGGDYGEQTGPSRRSLVDLGDGQAKEFSL